MSTCRRPGALGCEYGVRVALTFGGAPHSQHACTRTNALGQSPIRLSAQHAHESRKAAGTAPDPVPHRPISLRARASRQRCVGGSVGVSVGMQQCDVIVQRSAARVEQRAELRARRLACH